MRAGFSFSHSLCNGRKDNEMIFYLLSLPSGNVIHTKFAPIIVKDELCEST